MRNISFAKTTEQVRLQRKTVTRRVGWLFLKHGDLLQPIVKGQGIQKGGTVEKIGAPISCRLRSPAAAFVTAHRCRRRIRAKRDRKGKGSQAWTRESSLIGTLQECRGAGT